MYPRTALRGRLTPQDAIWKLLDCLSLGELGGLLKYFRWDPVREGNRQRPVSAARGVLFQHRPERLGSDPVDETYDGGPEPAVDEGELR